MKYSLEASMQASNSFSYPRHAFPMGKKARTSSGLSWILWCAKKAHLRGTGELGAITIEAILWGGRGKCLLGQGCH